MTSGLSWCAVGSNGTADEEIVQMKPKRARLSGKARAIVSILEVHGWLLKLDGSSEIGGRVRRNVWKLVEAST